MDPLENCSSQLNGRTCNAGTDHRTHVTLTDLSGEDWKRTEKRLSCAGNNVVLTSEFTGVDHFEDWSGTHSSSTTGHFAIIPRATHKISAVEAQILVQWNPVDPVINRPHKSGRINGVGVFKRLK